MFKSVILFLVCAILLSTHSTAIGDTVLYSMSGSGNGRIYEVDVTKNSYSFVGRLTPGGNDFDWASIAEGPDGTLYFVQRFQTSDHVFSVNADDIKVNSQGNITDLKDLGPAGVGGNVAGLCMGPDGNLYYTAYRNTDGGPINGLFRYDIATGKSVFVGAFSGFVGGKHQASSFHTDFAFDPITNTLIGLGFDSKGNYIPYVLPDSEVLTGSNQVFTYKDALPTWDASLNEGLAFDASGNIYACGPDNGVYLINKTTGAVIGAVGDTAGTSLGSDLASAYIVTASSVPEPSGVTLLGLATLVLAAMGRSHRRRRATASPECLAPRSRRVETVADGNDHHLRGPFLIWTPRTTC